MTLTQTTQPMTVALVVEQAVPADMDIEQALPRLWGRIETHIA